MADARQRDKRQQLDGVYADLELERASFVSHWKDLSDYIMPRRARFLVSDRNRGDRRRNLIIDSTATYAARTLGSMMMGGITAPSRPWFRLGIGNSALSENQDIMAWLHQLEELMRLIFIKSNLYNVLPITYREIGVYGTSCVFVEEDLDQIVRFYAIPIGSYMLGVDGAGRIDMFAREFEMTIHQLVSKFGERDPKTQEVTNWDVFSPYIQEQWKEGRRQQPVIVRHHVFPNDDYVPDSIDPMRRRVQSVYYERGQGQQARYGNAPAIETLGLLRERGYDFFPVLAPRWEVTGEDAYGTNCPGMTALGDIKQLQLAERRVAQAIDKMVNPPLIGPTTLRHTKTSLLPGDVTHLDERDGQRGLRPIHEVQLRIGEVEAKNDQLRSRIRRAFFEDLALQMILSDRREMTATEVEERSKEKLLALGPVLEQLNQDLLDPLIDITFSLMERQGLVPPPPDELAGETIRVDYISIMAQAQKAVGTNNIDRVIARAVQDSQVYPEVLDKINFDQVIDVYADMNSLPPGIINSDDDVLDIRQQRAQQAQQQAKMQAIAQGASAAKDLASADMSGSNALTAMVGGN